MSCPGLPILLLSRFLLPALLFLSVPTLLSCLFVPTLLSLLIPILLTRPLVLVLLSPFMTTLLSPFMPVLLSLPVPALLSLFVPALLFCFIFSLTLTHLTSSALRTFKQTLSDGPLGRQSISSSPPEPLCLFPILGLLAKKSNHQQLFDTAFINSRPLAVNYIIQEINLNFKEYGCLTSVKLNQLWQLELLDGNPVCIMEAFWQLHYFGTRYLHLACIIL